MNTDVLIIGGGLAGLSLARQLEARGCSWRLIEARARYGGRILSEKFKGASYDLGPSWFWPVQQRIAGLVKDLGLSQFDQAFHGDQLYQDESGKLHRGQGMVSMQGSWRLQGGLGQLVAGLVTDLPVDKLQLNSPVVQLAQTNVGVTASMASGEIASAKQVVLTLPPRVAMQLQFKPALPDEAVAAAIDIPTWMAGHAKAVALYKTPFWLDQGLSGDAMSRSGPLVEIHDASPFKGGPYALFGFIGTPAGTRAGNTQALKRAIRDQLGRIFGEEGLDPDELIVKDWAFDRYTGTEYDFTPPQRHPAYGRPEELTNLWGGRLHFGSTEMGAQYGGYLEGALEVADELAGTLA